MQLTPRTKHMALGGAIGAVGVAIAMALFHGRRASAEPRPRELHDGKHKKHHKNDRGEYGKKRHHKERRHGG